MPNKRIAIARPLWIVGVSPFDPVITEDAGHVVHLGEPRFTARWSMNPDTIAGIPHPDFHDQELGIVIYEVLTGTGNEHPADPWLLEAVCAVAYSKGLMAAAVP